ncbi:polysaccharide biosynthesis/export family protein [Pseudoalteromonas rubra]|uniref:Polysaccharide biosynthesis protein n=1 Tax=Pseudoalteromonas rubra TaxID=43658 RepID=A0A0F4QY42_9GAMM|nr:polysaccharide biosynthesis/export family protein [Pseudoalteromonas rubra]KJZ12259.1 polysaccharide biosynthesis protein [Pseudoalteromonas rubra]
MTQATSTTTLMTRISALVLCVLGTGCTLSPDYDEDDFYGMPHATGTQFNQSHSVFASRLSCTDADNFAAAANFRVDQPIPLAAPGLSPNESSYRGAFGAAPLSPGDLIQVRMEYGEGFNGDYVLDSSGALTLPVIEPIYAAGLTTKALAQKVELALIRAKIFRAQTLDVTVKVKTWAAIEVPVSGAVFSPGRVTINAKLPEQLLDQQVAASGDHSKQRLLSEAIRAAAGVRPDAKLDQVILVRQGWRIEADLTGIMTGQPVKDHVLIAGDQVIVPSTGCFQPNLVKPSQITPKGFRVFMSNLIDSSMSNANAAIGRFSSNLPYGTRLLQAAISANCVGGKEYTNAPRRIVLVSNHPLTGKTQVIERSVEELMRKSYRDHINPYVMPNDAIACYDSDITNLRDIARTLLDIVSPFSLLSKEDS